MVIKAKLNSADIKRMADDVERYQTEFQIKVHTVLRKLADKGIAAAALSVGNMGQYITFTKQNDPYGVTIVAQETSVIVAEWLQYGKTVHAETKNVPQLRHVSAYIRLEGSILLLSEHICSRSAR